MTVEITDQVCADLARVAAVVLDVSAGKPTNDIAVELAIRMLHELMSIHGDEVTAWKDVTGFVWDMPDPPPPGLGLPMFRVTRLRVDLATQWVTPS